jgi:hypothetical protein
MRNLILHLQLGFFLVAAEFTLHLTLVNRQEMTRREMTILALSCPENPCKSTTFSFPGCI